MKNSSNFWINDLPLKQEIKKKSPYLQSPLPLHPAELYMDIESLLLAEITVISKGRAFPAFSGYLTEENSKDFWKSFLAWAAELPSSCTPSPSIIIIYRIHMTM